LAVIGLLGGLTVLEETSQAQLTNVPRATSSTNMTPIIIRASPDTLDPLVVDYPTRLAQSLGDFAIAVAAVLPGKLDNVGRQRLLRLTSLTRLLSTGPSSVRDCPA
jgi:hypothetical protein